MPSYSTYSQLPAASTSLTGTEIISFDQGGVTSQATLNYIAPFFLNACLAEPVNLVSNVIPSVSTSITITADQLTLAASLSGSCISIGIFNQTNDISTNGAGGLDTGTLTGPGYAAIYAIYNPSTLTVSTLSTNATSSAAPEIYAGSHMPSGYTYSRLISVWPITSSSNTYVVGNQIGRTIYFTEVVYTTSVSTSGWTSVSIANAVPLNAKRFGGRIAVVANQQSTGIPQFEMSPAGSAVGNIITFPTTVSYECLGSTTILDMPIAVGQTAYYQVGGTGQFANVGGGFNISSYTF